MIIERFGGNILCVRLLSKLERISSKVGLYNNIYATVRVY